MNRYLVIENLALRQQLAIMKQRVRRPAIRTRDRIFWMFLSMIWKDWKNALIVVQPETVIRWHRKGFKLFWRFKSKKRRTGRPSIDSDIRKLIEDMAKANPLWGAPRMHGELMKLGIEIHERTVSKIIRKFRNSKPPSQTWRTFLKNHMFNTFAIDFFAVPTASFRVLYVCVILQHESRKIRHFNVTGNPTAKWTAQQIVEACPWDTSPKYLLRDRDGIYGQHFQSRVNNMGINEVKIAPRSPWQNPYVERLIGSIRRECLDHVIVLNERHLQKILSSYFEYYNQDRTHCGLDKDVPTERLIQSKPSSDSMIIKTSRVGGLHHRYQWKEAA